jgi:hypothetical protein
MNLNSLRPTFPTSSTVPVTSDTELPTVPVTSDTEFPARPVTCPVVPVTVLPTSPTAPGVDTAEASVELPEPQSEDDVDELVTLLPSNSTVQAADEEEVQPPRITEIC